MTQAITWYFDDFHVKEVRPSASRPERGVLVTVWQASNQHGELVATVEGMGMFGRRPARPTGAAIPESDPA